jgi:hypothetical protein
MAETSNNGNRRTCGTPRKRQDGACADRDSDANELAHTLAAWLAEKDASERIKLAVARRFE